nr:hypothetical protein [Tanacetum cinerariifolium]
QFWHSIKKVQGTNSYEFLLANQKCIINAEIYKMILDIYPRVEDVDFTNVPNDDTALAFLIELGYKGKGSQGKKTVDTHVIEVVESKLEPIKKRTSSKKRVKKSATISTEDNIISDPDIALELDKSIRLAEAEEAKAARKLKGVQSPNPKEQEAVDTMKAPKESRKSRKSQPNTRGSHEGTGSKTEVPDESTVVYATSSEGTGVKPRVLDEDKDITQEKVILDMGEDEDREQDEDATTNAEKDDKDDDADDKGDD